MLRKPAALILSSCLMTTACAGGSVHFSVPIKTKFHPIVRLFYSLLKIDTFLKNHLGDYLPRLPTPYNGLGFSGGFKYGQYVGLQLGYAYYFKLRRRTTINGQRYSIAMRPENTFFDVVGYFPILNVKGLDIVGTAGAVVNDFSFFLNNIDNGANSYHNSTNVNVRMGLGLRYLVTDHWAVDALYHYIPTHNNNRQAGGWKAFWTVNLGLSYLVR